ncbi:MAG: amidohydrolase family protein [Bacteroidetes bacterium]|nr:amidohydrolase family protein [Bacteroidota bacterium]MDA1122261.1 amidohydrolase family protein [Bacteroidota bacterium]
MKTVFHFLVAAIVLTCCQSPQSNSTSDENSESMPEEFKRFDVHSHYRYDRDCLMPLLDKWNMTTALIDVAAMDTLRNTARWEALKTQYNKYPGRFYLCASFAALNIDDPEFAKKTIEKLKMDIAAGAKMVKVWKVHGMEIKDKSGNYIQIDDERIQPVWDFLTEQNIPVMAHIGEPEQAWRELEEGNPHYNYYKTHPQYHAYLHPEIPRWETIIAARDNWIGKNPNLTILAAHMGSMSHDTGTIENS